jgi:APA family basic amino acid/polyamine antiporter
MIDPIPEAGPSGTKPEAMPAEFGPAMATWVIVASMVGVGVLTTSGYTVYTVGSNQLMLALWVLGGVVAVCGALTLCELSAALPRTGGDYVYLYEAYGPLPAFLSGWVSFLIGFAAPAAASAFGAAKFLLIPLHIEEGATASRLQRGAATLAVLVFAAIHASARRRTARIQGWITGLKIALLVLFLVAGLAVGWPRYANLIDRPPLSWPTAVAMMFSMVYISYAYTGWNAASYLAGEIAEPQRNLPRAILLGTGCVVALYVGLNVVYALALSAGDVRAIVDDPNNHLSYKPDAVAPIAQLAGRRLFGVRGSEPFTVAVGLMLLSSLSAYLLTGPRVIYAMAREGHFPAIAARLSARRQTPVIATILQTVATLVLLWTGSFESIVVFAGIGLAISSMLAIAAVYVLRRRRPELHRPFLTPGYPVTPAVYLVATAVLTAATFSQRPLVSSYALLSILAGVPIYYLQKRYLRSKAVPVDFD